MTVPVRVTPAGPVAVNVEVLIEVGFMALLNVAVSNDETGTAVAAFAGVTVTTSGNDTGACSRPQPAVSRIKRKARIDIVVTAGNLEIITLRMGLLFEFRLLNVILDGLLSHRRGPGKGAKQVGFRLVSLQERSCRNVSKKILGLT